MVTEQRSYNMSRIKSKDTSIELKVRKYLFHKGYRYQKNVDTLPGKPDIYISNIMLPFLLTVVFGTITTTVNIHISLKQIRNIGLINSIET